MTNQPLYIPADLPLEELHYTDGFVGYRVKTTETHHIEVWQFLVNWRLVTCPVDSPGCPERAWCYQGLGPSTFVSAVIAAYSWDGSDDTEPPGYFKRAH
jgi:hypothetical protein